jgi:transposase
MAMAPERRRVVCDLAEQKRQCPPCRGELRHMRSEISERLEYVPTSLYVIEEACHKYACA